MSESASTRSKTLTEESSEPDSAEDPLIADRWSNNIEYIQLVLSSCIGIVQVWWHPYLHDLRKLLPFMCLYNIFSIIVGYPMFYLELALGIVTKKGVLNCWDIAPMSRGVGFSMLCVCVFSALGLSVIAAWCLSFFVHSFHSFLPWLHCAAIATPACAARHRPLAEGSETPAQSFFFNFILHLKRTGLEGGLGTVNWEMALYFTFSWLVVYCVTVKRIYSYSKLVLFKDVLTYFVLLCCGLGVVRLNGASKMFQQCDWNVLGEGAQIWIDAIEYAIIELTLSQGSLIMLGTYCPKRQYKLGKTVLVSFLISKLTCTVPAMTLGAVYGALEKDYEANITLSQGPSSSMILWADYVARLPGSQFWSAVVFFTFFLLTISSVALIIQTIMSTFTGHSLRKITWTFLVVICTLFCIIGVMTLCTQGGLHIVYYLMKWPILKPRLVLAAMLCITITYAYGQTTFCEDVYFCTGEYPCMFLRMCWALIPGLLLGVFIAGMAVWPSLEDLTGWILVWIILLPVVIFYFTYLMFKCRVRNIVGNEK